MKEDKLKKYYYLALYILGIRGSLLVNIINNFTLQDIRKLFFSKEMFELAFKYDISLDKYSNIFSDDRKLYESLIMAMNIEAQHKMLGIETIPINDVRYPNKLRIIKNAPPIVYISGALLSEKEKAIGCVGGKDISDFGKRAINSLVSNLVRDGYRIVSSLDKGADKTIIERCIECGGRPIVVLPYGLTKTYYKKDKIIKELLNSGGTIITEHPIVDTTTIYNYHYRDRLISALSDNVVMIEGSEKSHCINIIDFAKKQNKVIFTPLPKEEEKSKILNYKLIDEYDAIPLLLRKDYKLIEECI